MAIDMFLLKIKLCYTVEHLKDSGIHYQYFKSSEHHSICSHFIYVKIKHSEKKKSLTI